MVFQAPPIKFHVNWWEGQSSHGHGHSCEPKSSKIKSQASNPSHNWVPPVQVFAMFFFGGGSTLVPSFAYGLTRRGFPPFGPRRGLQRRPVPLAAGLPRAAAALQREGAVPQRRHMQAWDREGGTGRDPETQKPGWFPAIPLAFSFFGFLVGCPFNPRKVELLVGI